MPSGNEGQIGRRRILQVAGSSVALAGFAGCSGLDGNGGGGNGGSTSSGDYPDLSGENIHFLTDESAQSIQDVLKQFVSDFESTTGATVNFETSGLGGTAQNRMAQLIQAGTPPEAFFGLEHSGAVTHAAQGRLAPVDDQMNLLSDRFGDIPSDYRIQRDGSDYFLPTSVHPPNVWLREDVLGEIPDQLTWESFTQLLADNDGAGGMPSYFQIHGKDTCTALITANWAASNGAYLAERKGESIEAALTADGNQQRWIDALEQMRELASHSPRNASGGCGDAIQSLSIEAASSTVYVGGAPKKAAIEAGRGFAGDIVGRLWPRPDGQALNKTYLAAKSMARFDTDANKASEAFLDFFVKEGYYVESLLGYVPDALPAIPAAYQNDTYQSGLQSLIEGSPWTQADLDGLSKAGELGRPLASDTEPPNTKIGVFFGGLDVAELIYDVVIDGTDPAAALEKYDAQLQEAFDQA